MSKRKKNQRNKPPKAQETKPIQPKVEAVVPDPTIPPVSRFEKPKPAFAFERANYMILFVGLGMILLGFVIMSMDKEPYGFGFLGLTLGPIILFIGFLIPIFAIFYKPKNER